MLSKTSLTVKAPGKLMIAGEFAVLEPYKRLAVMAVDRFVYANISLAGSNRLTLENFQLRNMEWDFTSGRVSVQSDDERVNFVASAMSVALSFIGEENISWQPFYLSIKSELDDEASGKKYGLGSSAAVSVSVITAILQQFLQEKPDAELVFKLAAISHARTQGNGSGADVAASAFGGIIAYSSFQAYWLRDAYQEASSLKALLAREWPYLSLRPVQLPQHVHVCIGWTGSPASTANLVDKVLELKKHDPHEFDHFLQTSEIAVGKFMAGIEQDDIEKLFEGVRRNRETLRRVGQAAGVPIETPMLTTLCDLAISHGGAGKPSGAGGGDCGIAFMPDEKSVKELKAAWEKAGIQALDLQISPDGAAAVL